MCCALHKDVLLWKCVCGLIQLLKAPATDCMRNFHSSISLCNCTESIRNVGSYLNVAVTSAGSFIHAATLHVAC